MKTLKAKFGKFAISNEKMAKVSGGLTCHAGGAKIHFDDDNNALKFCKSDANCVGCF